MELFDKLLRGELDEKETQAIKEKLLIDKQFSKDFELYQICINALQLTSIELEMKSIIERKNRSSKKWYYAVAAIAVLLVPFIFLLLHKEPVNTNQNLFKTYYFVYPGNQQIRGVSQEDEAMKFYANREFESAAIAFEQLLANDSSKITLHLYLGNCYLNINKPKLAIKSFSISENSESTIIAQNSEWYLALAFIKSENNAKAKAVLSKIARSKHLYSQKASEILSLLM